MTVLGIFILLLFYILSVLLTRYLNKIVYLKIDSDWVIIELWFIPLMNLLVIFVFLCMIISFNLKKIDFFNKFWNSFSGNNWDQDRLNNENRIRNKRNEKHRDIDPYGEENWTD